MLYKVEKILRSLLPIAILLGLLLLPFRAKLQSYQSPPRNQPPQLTDIQKPVSFKPLYISVNDFLKSQRALLKYDENGNLIPDIANKLSTTLNIYLKIVSGAQLPDGRNANSSSIESYLKSIGAQGKNDERLKDIVAVKSENDDVVKFTFSPIHTGSLELLYELFGENVFSSTPKPRFEEIIEVDTPRGVKSFHAKKLSYLEIEKLATPLIHDNFVKPDNIKVTASSANDYILIRDTIPANLPKSVTAIPSTLTKAKVLGFNLANPKFQNRAIRQVIRNSLSGNVSRTITGSSFSILFAKDDLSLANDIATTLKGIGCKVKLVSVNDEDQLFRELYNGFQEAFIITLYKTTFDWEHRYFSSNSLPNWEPHNMNFLYNFFYFTDSHADKDLERLDQTFDTKERDNIKRRILERVREETPCVFLKDEPICYYLIGQKNDLKKIVDNAHKEK